MTGMIPYLVIPCPQCGKKLMAWTILKGSVCCNDGCGWFEAMEVEELEKECDQFAADRQANIRKGARR